MLHVATVATESKYYLPYLQQTCAQWGVKLQVLGMGEKWEGYVFKFKKIIDFLNTIPPKDIVCFVDGYDVVATRNLNELVPAFLKLKEHVDCSIVVADDGNLPFALNFLKKDYFGDCNNNYLNSGTYMGFASDLLQILTDAFQQFPEEKDDQKLLTLYCSRNPSKFYVDKKCEFFQVSIQPFFEMKLNTNPRPFFAHAAGCGYLTNILQDMGYQVDPEIKKNLRHYMIKKVTDHAIVFMTNHIFFFCFFFTLLFYLLCKLIKKIFF